jgi:hypothetical protein
MFALAKYIWPSVIFVGKTKGRGLLEVEMLYSGRSRGLARKHETRLEIPVKENTLAYLVSS